jgi:hypothetical protein
LHGISPSPSPAGPPDNRELSHATLLALLPPQQHHLRRNRACPVC